MPYRANYPATVTEILDDRATFKPEALRAIRELARSKPWRGTEAERTEKFSKCLAALSAAYGIARPGLRIHWSEGSSGSSHYTPAAHTITLVGRPSVVTFLHEFGHARGFDERQAVRWSVNLFRRCFPRSYSRCRHVGHTLVSTSHERSN